MGCSVKWDGAFNIRARLVSSPKAVEPQLDTVERELWEEAGIKLLGLKYHSTQPWPFPANIMAGFYAVADSSEPVRTDLDNELEGVYSHLTG